MVTILIRWLIFLHVLSAITFFLAHGASAAMAFRVRKETDFARIRALLDLSWSTMILMGVSFLIMGLTCIIRDCSEIGKKRGLTGSWKSKKARLRKAE